MIYYMPILFFYTNYGTYQWIKINQWLNYQLKVIITWNNDIRIQ